MSKMWKRKCNYQRIRLHEKQTALFFMESLYVLYYGRYLADLDADKKTKRKEGAR